MKCTYKLHELLHTSIPGGQTKGNNPLSTSSDIWYVRWARQDSNLRPWGYEPRALPLSYRPDSTRTVMRDHSMQVHASEPSILDGQQCPNVDLLDDSGPVFVAVITSHERDRCVPDIA